MNIVQVYSQTSWYALSGYIPPKGNKADEAEIHTKKKTSIRLNTSVWEMQTTHKNALQKTQAIKSVSLQDY